MFNCQRFFYMCTCSESDFLSDQQSCFWDIVRLKMWNSVTILLLKIIPEMKGWKNI